MVIQSRLSLRERVRNFVQRELKFLGGRFPLRTFAERKSTTLLVYFIGSLLALDGIAVADENDYYRIVTIATSQADTQSRSKFWKPAADDLALEVSGIATLPDAGVAVTIRKGEIWIIDGVYDDPPENLKYHRFAQALQSRLVWPTATVSSTRRSDPN